jgi:mannosyltransferase OCH1-like enzyme
MAIHQIFISSQNDRQLPPYFQNAVNSIRVQMPDHDHHLYFFEDLRDWIKNNYDEPIILAFDKLEPYAYKADLARYLLLYKLGGVVF